MAVSLELYWREWLDSFFVILVRNIPPPPCIIKLDPSEISVQILQLYMALRVGVTPAGTKLVLKGTVFFALLMFKMVNATCSLSKPPF